MWIDAIVAVDQGWLMGHNGQLPWHLPDDFKHFKRTTMGLPVIMGRLTWESLKVRPLPGRQNVVVSRQQGYEAPGALVVQRPELAVEALAAQGAQGAMIIGGAQLYRLFMPRLRYLYLTVVHTRCEPGDTYFPALDPQAWSLQAREDHPADARHAYAFSVLRLARIGDEPLAGVPQVWS